MIRFEDLLDKVRGYSPDADLELLRQAYVFSALEHKGQIRHSGEPYLVHPLEVADILADMKLDAVCIAAGLLHDVVEDTLTTPEKIREKFGEDVAHIVEGVTKIGAIPFSSTEERQAENFRKMLLAMVDDIRVILVKLADRLHNMRTLQHMADDKRVRIAQETLDIYAPIANRLGMSRIKNELEELSFRYLEPAAFQSLQDPRRGQAPADAGDDRAARRRHPQQAERGAGAGDQHRRPRQAPLQHLAEAQGAEDRSRAGLRLRRAAHRHAVGEGLLRRARHHPPDVVAGARPHQGLHRDAAAQRLPVAAHLGDQRSRASRSRCRSAPRRCTGSPKKASPRTGNTRKAASARERDEQYFQWLRQLLEWQQEVRDPQEFLSNLKIDLYPEEVYTFTPRGTVKVLPKGSTAIDFAYAIHTDVGHQCVGARVNGRMVPLRTRLKNGDIVEIVRNAAHKPSRDWLNFAVTSRARNKIKHLIQVEEKERAVELGQARVRKGSAPLRPERHEAARGRHRARCSPSSRPPKPEDLLAQIGYGKVSPRLVLDKIVPQDQLKEQAPEHPVVSAVKRVLRQGSEPDRIKVRGADDVMVFRAKCCNPIRGEKIVGYITRGKGVSVHSAKCTNVINLMYDPERRIDVEWDKGSRHRAVHRCA